MTLFSKHAYLGYLLGQKQAKICLRNLRTAPYEYLDSILLITQKPGHFSASPLGYTLNILKCTKEV